MTDATKTTDNAADETSPHANDPMYLALVADKEIRELARQINKLADRYDFKEGVEARLITELLKSAGHIMGRVQFGDIHEVEKANVKDMGK